MYAASSSTYGDSEALPKVEEVIGRPLSPYAITKYVNELYADVFSRTYGIECIGLRYFNVFGRKQDPNGAYAAVISLFVKQLVNYLKSYLSEYDPAIADVEIQHGPNRAGDIPHSLASIKKAKTNLGYNPLYNMKDGLREAVLWYWENLK